MLKQVFIVSATILAMVACNNSKNILKENKTSETTETTKEQKPIDIPFVVANRYFVKNTVKTLDNPKIEIAEKFEEIFGMATVIRKDGKPTPIDFTKQYVISVILPAIDIAANLSAISLQKDNQGAITFTYKYDEGEKQT